MKRSASLFQRLLALFLALVLCLLLPGCQKGQQDEAELELPPLEEPEYPVTAAGATLAGRPGKVVSLAPALTEKLYDLNMGERLVGVSDYCGELTQADGLPGCGTVLLPDLERIEALAPQLVLTQGELSEEAVERLAALDIQVAVLPHANSMTEMYNNYRAIATLLEGAQTGEQIGDAFVDRFHNNLSEIADLVEPYLEETGFPKILYLRLLDFTVATGDTLENELMRVVGLSNVARDYARWSLPEGAADNESIRADLEGLDMLFLDERDVTITMLEQHDYYKTLPVVREDRYCYIDALAFEVQSMAMLDQLRIMMDACVPEAGLLDGATAPEREDGVEVDPETGEEPGADTDEETVDEETA